jgi:methionine-rich copper-binding protein CopC
MPLSKKIASALFALAFSAGPALAHVSVKTTSIENAAVIEELPEAFSFSFSQPVVLVAFSIRNGSGEAVNLGFKPPKAPADTFTVPLPDLTPGLYTVEWRTLSKDGHPMTGKSIFELK